MPRSKIVLRYLLVFLTLIVCVTLILETIHPSLARNTISTTLTPSDFSVPNGSDPWGTTFDSQGNVWLAVPGCDPSTKCPTNTPPGEIEVYSPSSSSWTQTLQLPSGYAQAFFVAFDNQGRVWFPAPNSNALEMYNTTNHTFHKWNVPTLNAQPWDVTIDHQGKVWFTEHNSNKIGCFNPATHTFREIATPTSNSMPYGITVDANNNIWFTENNSSVALIGEYTSADKLLEYKIRNTTDGGLTPHLITVDQNGNIWWTEGFVGAIAELTIAQAVPGTNHGVSEYFYPPICSTCGMHTSGISVDSNGNIWFDDSLQSIFGSFPESGTGSFSIYNTSTSNSHPHDGLNVDGQNRIWFDEEFANKLAEVVQTNMPTLAQDTFQRPNQALWGTASDGQTWGGDANTLSVFSIVNNTGQVANSRGIYNAILGPTATDAEVLFSGSISNFSSTNLGAVLRWTDTNNWYKAYINGVSLVIQKKVAGVLTTLRTASFAASAGTSYTLRFHIVGTTLFAKIWQTGTGEPTNWLITTTDSSLQSGFCGLRMQLQTGAAADISSFLATVA